MTDPKLRIIERTLAAIIEHGPNPDHWPAPDQARYRQVSDLPRIKEALALAQLVEISPAANVPPSPSAGLRSRILDEARRTPPMRKIFARFAWSPARRVLQAGSVMAAAAVGVTAAYAATPGPTPEAQFLAYASYGAASPGGLR